MVFFTEVHFRAFTEDISAVWTIQSKSLFKHLYPVQSPHAAEFIKGTNIPLHMDLFLYDIFLCVYSTDLKRFKKYSCLYKQGRLHAPASALNISGYSHWGFSFLSLKFMETCTWNMDQFHYEWKEGISKVPCVRWFNLRVSVHRSQFCWQSSPLICNLDWVL